jgi:Ca2+-binding RTX toxin-like protein
MIAGSNSNDFLAGTQGSDEIFALDGDDRVWLTDDVYLNGNDFVDLGSGNDILFAAAGSAVVEGGEGSDTIDFSYITNVSVTYDMISPFQYNYAFNNMNIVAYSIENVSGSSNSDFLYGDSQSNVIHGNAGSDIVFGRGGADTLYGGDGDDTMAGGAGLDVIFGGSGVDWFEFFSANSGYYQASERDYIVDFELGVDKIAIDTDLALDFNNLLQNASIYQDSTSTVIEFNNGSEFLILNFFNVNNISSEMFLFYQI